MTDLQEGVMTGMFNIQAFSAQIVFDDVMLSVSRMTRDMNDARKRLYSGIAMTAIAVGAATFCRNGKMMQYGCITLVTFGLGSAILAAKRLNDAIFQIQRTVDSAPQHSIFTQYRNQSAGSATLSAPLTSTQYF